MKPLKKKAFMTSFEKKEGEETEPENNWLLEIIETSHDHGAKGDISYAFIKITPGEKLNEPVRVEGSKKGGAPWASLGDFDLPEEDWLAYLKVEDFIDYLTEPQYYLVGINAEKGGGSTSTFIDFDIRNEEGNYKLSREHDPIVS